jgi:hypothetical protein
VGKVAVEIGQSEFGVVPGLGYLFYPAAIFSAEG